MAHEAAWLTSEKQGLAGLLLQSHQRAFGQPLIAAAQAGRSKRLLCQELFACGFPVLAHGTEKDPQLGYANAAAPAVETNWDELIGMPSRLTHRTANRQNAAAPGPSPTPGCVRNYRGIRISRKGRRFMINNAKIWTLWNAEERLCGQAACFSDWWWI